MIWQNLCLVLVFSGLIFGFQFMLIWYANIPEEITYFITRIEMYNLPFFGAVVMNFVFPNIDFNKFRF
jgi:hypothetical protein